MNHKTADLAALTLVVPLFDEAPRLVGDGADEIAAFVAAQPAGSELLFVDEASTDGTVEAAAAFLARRPDLRARLIRRPQQGKGAAVRAGLEEARSPLAGVCEVDLATPLGDFARLVDAARRDGGVIVGSSAGPGSAMADHDESPARQGSVRETLAKACTRVAGPRLLDRVYGTRCGATVAPTAVWRRILPYCGEDGLAWQVEVLAIAKALEIPITEKGVSSTHADESPEQVLRDGLAMLRSLPRIRRRAQSAPSREPPAGTSLLRAAIRDG